MIQIGDNSSPITHNDYINISDFVGNCVETFDQFIDHFHPNIAKKIASGFANNFNLEKADNEAV